MVIIACDLCKAEISKEKQDGRYIVIDPTLGEIEINIYTYAKGNPADLCPSCIRYIINQEESE